ncbi:hypothetical protein ACGFRG_24740 [Streptomyces sp. NPDC048696]|uniref:hypothetical protein n=1 Tax=Streptomyces sp. NPDC048696 TaxID=3365585 RepID=UPI00371F0973
MEVTVTMVVCDVCKRQDRPAQKYLLAVGDTEPVRKDLCVEDAAPVVALFFEPEAAAPEAAVTLDGPQGHDRETARPAREPAAPAKKAAAKRAPAKKATAKKTTAKKTATRRKSLGARTLTPEQIEAEKAAARAKDGS